MALQGGFSKGLFKRAHQKGSSKGPGRGHKDAVMDLTRLSQNRCLPRPQRDQGGAGEGLGSGGEGPGRGRVGAGEAREGPYRCRHGLNVSFPRSLSPQIPKGPGRGWGGAGEEPRPRRPGKLGRPGRPGRLERLMFL